MRKFYAFLAAAALASGLTVMTGCGPKPQAQESVAVVNGTPIARQDFQRELAFRASQDPSFKVTSQTIEDQLNVMVNRKLLIEEAIQRKLTLDDRFRSAIRTYWEQTLVRLLMEKLDKEFSQTVYATEQEVVDYYAKLDSRATFGVLVGKNRPLIEQALVMAQKGEKLEWDDTVGPVTYDEVNSDVLEESFGMAAGEYKIYEKDGLFYLIHVIAKEPAARPERDAVREKIEGKIKLRKQRLAFEQWLKEKKSKADIKINLEAIHKGDESGLTQTAAQ